MELRRGSTILILDAGTGIRPLGAALAAEFGNQSLQATILLTHTHSDHIQGFPFFAPVYEARNRIRIVGFEGARESLARVLASQMESPFFPVALNELPGNICIEVIQELSFQIGPIRVQAMAANHPGVCMGYRLETEEGVVVYLPDHEPYSPQEVYGGGLARQKHEELLAFLAGAQLLILDSQYDAAEYATHVGWGHGCVDAAVGLALEARVRRLCLFHHDPNHSDLKIMEMLEHGRQLARRSGGELEIEAAREGISLRL